MISTLKFIVVYTSKDKQSLIEANAPMNSEKVVTVSRSITSLGLVPLITPQKEQCYLAFAGNTTCS